jgi:NADH-quinone oxidoreductase subunit J
MKLLHFLLCFFLVISSLLVASSISPVESVLFLILSFFNAAAILFLFNVEFLGLILVIVYVGAVAVLFLFVIMMLNIKIQKDENTENLRRIYLFGVFFLYILSVMVLLFINKTFSTEDLFLLKDFQSAFHQMDTLNNIDVLGQVLYNYFLVCFLIAGLILLVALVGSITLTLRFNTTQKSQIVSRQLSRTDNFLSFFR